MKRILMAVMAVALAGSSTAGAQSDELNKYGKFTLKGCYFIQEGLRCDLSYTSTRDFRPFFYDHEFKVTTPDGVTYEGQKVAAAGKGWVSTTGTGSIDVYSGVPVPISVVFNVPKASRSLAVFNAYGNTLRNVNIGGAAATPAPAPVNVGGVSYNAVLTDCQTGANGVMVCVATLAPRK